MWKKRLPRSARHLMHVIFLSQVKVIIVAMSFLHTLRNTPWLAKLALLWFAVTLGVAVASPLVNPQQELLICTSVGMAKVVLADDGSVTTNPVAQAHCPLCLTSGLPPSFVSLVFEPLLPLGRVLQSIPAARIAALTGAPPPSRAPPSFL